MLHEVAQALLTLQLNTLTKAEILALSGLSPNGFEQALLSGRAPEPLPRLAHTRLWLKADVEAWLAGPNAPRRISASRGATNAANASGMEPGTSP
jgi:hypothetical protein